MKRLSKISLVALALLAGVTFSAKAQTTSTSRPSGLVLSVGVDGGLPLGNFKDDYNWSIGGSLQAEYPIIKKDLYVVLNAGYDNFFAKKIDGVKGQDLQLIPVKAGLKFYPVGNFYIQGLAGVSFIANKSDFDGSKSTVFVYSPQIGYLFNLGKGSFIDAGVKFEGNAKFVDSGESNNFLGLRIAYSFGI